jgi:arabinogalactan oligomer / maltooligosaccharide transport system permease protein
VTSVAYPQEAVLAARRAKAKRRRARRRFAGRMVKRLLILAMVVVALGPTYLVVIASINRGGSFFSTSLVPHGITWHNYKMLFTPVNQGGSDFVTWVKNSLIVCFAVATIATVCSGLMGYAFSRLRFRGRKWGLMGLLLIQIFPTVLAIPAFYYLLLWMQNHFKIAGHVVVGLGTYQGLILVLSGGALAFNSWLFKGYLDNLPRELEEAAFVDGATRLRMIWHVVIPLAKPITAVIFLFTFIGVYSEYAVTSIVMNASSHYTLPVGMRGFIFNEFSQNWTIFAAGAVVSSVPILIVFLGLQRYLVSGLARGAVRG